MQGRLAIKNFNIFQFIIAQYSLPQLAQQHIKIWSGKTL